MLFREMTGVIVRTGAYFKNHMKHTNAISGKMKMSLALRLFVHLVSNTLEQVKVQLPYCSSCKSVFLRMCEQGEEIATTFSRHECNRAFQELSRNRQT